MMNFYESAGILDELSSSMSSHQRSGHIKGERARQSGGRRREKTRQIICLVPIRPNFDQKGLHGCCCAYMSIHLGFVSEGADLRLTCAVRAFLSIRNRPKLIGQQQQQQQGVVCINSHFL